MPNIKEGWAMPKYEATICAECGETVRPIAVDVGSFEPESDLSISCLNGCTWIDGVEWPFEEERVTIADLEAVGFTCLG